MTIRKLFLIALSIFLGQSQITENYWTKTGLEKIPWQHWNLFSDDNQPPYILYFPLPGEMFTDDHMTAWSQLFPEETHTIESLTNEGIISSDSTVIEVDSVPTLFTKPIWKQMTPLDERIAYIADLESKNQHIDTQAVQGRLVNPSGRRLREHFYRFPDQCDATLIALEVFLRLMIYDQIEAFFHEDRIGMWHDLFPEVQRRPYDHFEISLARWYGERYAENYLHTIDNGWVYPLERQSIDSQMIAMGLNPSDNNTDPTTSIGLGNIVGDRATQWMRENDMLHADEDFVDIEMLNTIREQHPDPAWHQWEPTFKGSGRFQGIRPGIVTRQTFVTPSMGLLSFLYENEQDFIDLGLEDAVMKLDTSEDAYVERASKFMDVQRNLTWETHALAEMANNKITGSVFLIKSFVALMKTLVSTEDFNRYYDDFSMVTSGCEYAAVHAGWRHKRTYYAGRPHTVVKNLAKRNQAFREEYPEAETFMPYIPPGDHPEYPSGSAIIYTAFAQSGDNWFRDVLGFENASDNTGPLEFTVPKDDFYWTDEKPDEDVTLTFNNLTDWINQLTISRVYAGVHFHEAGEAGINLGRKVGDACTRMYNRMREGDMRATYPYENREIVNAFNTYADEYRTLLTNSGNRIMAALASTMVLALFAI